MDEQGKVIERSEVSIDARFISLSPNEQTVAFIGNRRGESGFLLALAEFQGQKVRKLMPASAPSYEASNVRPSNGHRMGGACRTQFLTASCS